METSWFLFWRMALWMLVLLAALGTVCGSLVGGLTFPYGIGFLINGPIFGAMAGLGLVVLEGAAFQV